MVLNPLWNSPRDGLLVVVDDPSMDSEEVDLPGVVDPLWNLVRMTSWW